MDLIDNNERTPLHVAAAYNHLKTVRCLLRHRAVVDWPDVGGCTALARAAGRGHAAVVQARRCARRCWLVLLLPAAVAAAAVFCSCVVRSRGRCGVFGRQHNALHRVDLLSD